MSIEESEKFTPKFDDKGLIPCVVKSAKDGAVLMVAWMNEKALRLTLETSLAHYWSRSRGEIWQKGLTSGNTQKVIDIMVDCDQDCLLMTVEAKGDTACHTGRRSCFYRKVGQDGKLILCRDGNALK